MGVVHGLSREAGSSWMAKLISFSTSSVLVLTGGIRATGMVTVGTEPVVSMTAVWYGQGNGKPQIIPGEVRSGCWQYVIIFAFRVVCCVVFWRLFTVVSQLYHCP